MIGKLMQNDSFSATFGYCFGKSGAKIVGGNVALLTERSGMNQAQAQELIRETAQIYNLSRNQNREVKRPVYHVALSLPHDDYLTDEQWSDLSDRYLAGLILGSQKPSLLNEPAELKAAIATFIEEELPKYQYAIVQHDDKKHRHVHIVLSRINLETGRAVQTWRDRYRSQKVLRLLESEYGLRRQANSWESGRREQSKNQILKSQMTGALPVQTQLQNLLDHLAADRPTIPELIERLQERGVEVNVQFTRTGKPKGISYALDGVAMAGNKLGNRYSFNGLQRQLGVVYTPEQNEQIQAVLRLTPEQRKQVEAIAPTMVRFLTTSKTSTFVFNKYTLNQKKNEISFFESHSQKIVAKVVWFKDKQSWQAIENNFTPELWKQWKQIEVQLPQAQSGKQKKERISQR